MAMAAVPSPPLVAATASLYVGDLDAEVTEGQLFEMFSKIGVVASIRVCRDSISRRSLGYAYVNYNTSVDAARALEFFNYTLVNGKAIRIMWSHRDPSARKIGVGNIFIKNLHESIDNKALHDTFSAFGNILSCKVASQDGKSKGYGFVHFESEESANIAIEKVNGMLIEGKKVYVGRFMKRIERAAFGAEQKFTNLYIKNLDQDVTEDLLNEKFSAFGKINNLVIMKDEHNKSKGFGFINFDNPDDAKQAVEVMNGTKMGSKVIYVGRAQKKAEREQILQRQFEQKRQERMLKYQGANVYVKNLDDAIDEEELQEQFGPYGTITSAKVMRDEKGLSKGFGFVCFATPEEANKAVAELHGCIMHGKPIYVAIAQRKEVRQAQLKQQYSQHVAGLAGPHGAVLPAAYPPMYYMAPAGIVPQIPHRQGIMYHPLGLRPGWRAGGIPHLQRPGFQPVPLAVIPNNQSHQRQIRGGMNGSLLPQAGQPMVSMLQMQQQNQFPVSYKDTARNQQRPQQPLKFMPNGRAHEMNITAKSSAPLAGFPPQLAVSVPVPLVGVNSASAVNQGAEMLSSTLAAASPQQQKQMLGEHLFPLVQEHQYELAGKITGMLLEMDNSELLLLLESPDALATKVEEAIQVLHQHLKMAPENALPGNILTGEVAVS